MALHDLHRRSTSDGGDGDRAVARGSGAHCLLGTIDLRELRGEVSLPQALFNRTVVGLPSFLGSLAAHQILRSPGRSAWIVPISLLVLACETAANLGPLALVLSIQQRYPVYQVIRNLRLGRLSDFLLMFLACSVLGAMLSTLYDQIHSWALFAFIVPTLLSRQALLRSQMYLDRDHAYRSREAALEALSGAIRDERSDERRLIAADLHDEVLQPLYKASLMAHVLKADLASGRLLQLDEDIPELVAAAELAAATLRGLIGDLHRSPLGTGGVTAALRTLVRNMQRQVLARIQSEVEDIAGSSDHELTLYQIGKEALTNAAAHSQASNIWLGLSRREDASVLTVRDDGIGFDPQSGREGHFGIHIMRERAASVGGELWIDSSPGRGTVVSAILPLDPPEITTHES